MKYPTWLATFPMRRTKRGSTPGRGMFFRLDVRVQAGGNGFIKGRGANEPFGPMPVTNEQQATEVFLDLWRRAQAEAPAVQSPDAS